MTIEHKPERFEEPQSIESTASSALRELLAESNQEGKAQIEMSDMIHSFPSQKLESLTVPTMKDFKDKPAENEQNEKSAMSIYRNESRDVIEHKAAASQAQYREIDSKGNLHEVGEDGTRSVTSAHDHVERLQHLAALAEKKALNFDTRAYKYIYARPYSSPDTNESAQETTEAAAKRPSSRVMADVILAPGAMAGALTDKPFSLVSVHDLKIERQDGTVVLVTNNGTALVKENGSPVTAQELGQFMHSDGSIAVAAHGQPLEAGKLHEFPPSNDKQSASDKAVSTSTKLEPPPVRTDNMITPPPLFLNNLRKFERVISHTAPPPKVQTDQAQSIKDTKAIVRVSNRPLQKIVSSMRQSDTQSAPAEEKQASQPDLTNDEQRDEKKRAYFEQREIAQQGTTAAQSNNDPQAATQTAAPASGGNAAHAITSEEIAVTLDATCLLEDFQLDNFEIVFNTSSQAPA